MKLKLYKKSPVIRNLLFFIILNVLYLHIYNSIANGVTALSFQGLDRIFPGHIPFVVTGLLAFYATFRARKWSILMTAAYVLISLSYMIWIYALNTDKVLLLLIFLYVISAFYFVVLLFAELKSAIYFPAFYKNNIDKRPHFILKAKVTFMSGRKEDGFLTNWDDSSCFVLIDNKHFERESVRLQVFYDNLVFEDEGLIYTGYDSGLGIKFNSAHRKSYSFCWRDFFDVVRDRGFNPHKVYGA